MGLIQREIEKAGIPTISVTLSPEITRKVNVPRAVDFGFPLGHPFGFPDQEFLRRSLLALLLERLGSWNCRGSIEKIPVYDGNGEGCKVCNDLD